MISKAIKVLLLIKDQAIKVLLLIKVLTMGIPWSIPKTNITLLVWVCPFTYSLVQSRGVVDFQTITLRS